MKNILLKEELHTVLKNKKILIPIIAVMFVPVLYAGMFLWAFWDPYAKLEKLPVAVVNEDKGGNLDGEKITLGDDLVSKLEKSKEFGFVSVGKNEGYKKLKQQKYYMLIEIPKDFSKNATTLLDTNPKKMALTYVPNEGYNFLSAQIGTTAIEKIKTAVAENVTETYAETMFRKLTKLADGINQASNGAGQLNDGSADLNKGSKKLNSGLVTLTEKLIEYHNGMKLADAGAEKLSSGSGDLYSGLEIMAKKSIEFNNGMISADVGAKKVAAGTKDLNAGLETMVQKSADFNNGMKTADDGAGKVAAGAEDLNSGMATLAKKSVDLGKGVKDAATGSKNLVTGSNELKTGLVDVDAKLPLLIQGTAEVYTGARQLKSSLPAGIASEVQKQLTANIGDMNKGINDFESQLASGLSEQIATQTIAEQTAQLQELAKTLLANGVSQQLVNAIINQQQMYVPTKDKLEQQILSELKPKLDEGFNQLKSGMSQKLSGAANGLSDSISRQTDPYFDNLLTGIGEVNDNQKLLQQGIHALSEGSVQLNIGANKLSSGMDQLSGGADQLTAGTGKLSAGTNELTKGSSTLLTGMNQLTSGSNALTGGAGQLAEGSKSLRNGADDLSNGMNQLASGSTSIVSGSDQLAAGSKSLNSGVANLLSGMNQLTSGAGAITTGADQLKQGSEQLNDGTAKVSDGSKELADKLSAGSKEASKLHATNKTYNMMAKPVSLEKESLNRVPNYGTGFTPYFLSLGLFVGALLLSIVFSIREPAVAPASGFIWFISKFVILACLGIIQALIADTVILGGLKLHVQSEPVFILFSIITSLTFVTLIQLLVTVFADAGRFLAIVILILQLTTSAGTFPLELIPNFLQHFNVLLPMTYTVKGFKAVISSGDYRYMWQNFMILVIYVLAFALGTITYLTMRHKVKYKKLAVNE